MKILRSDFMVGGGGRGEGWGVLLSFLWCRTSVVALEQWRLGIRPTT